MGYQETVVDRPPTADPAALVVGFRLRAVRGRGHALRWSAFLGPSTTSFVPGLHRDELINEPRLGAQLGMQDWSRPTQVLSNVG